MHISVCSLYFKFVHSLITIAKLNEKEIISGTESERNWSSFHMRLLLQSVSDLQILNAKHWIAFKYIN